MTEPLPLLTVGDLKSELSRWPDDTPLTFLSPLKEQEFRFYRYRPGDKVLVLEINEFPETTPVAPPGGGRHRNQTTDPHEKSLAIATTVRLSLFDHSRADTCCRDVSPISRDGMGSAEQCRALCRSPKCHSWMHLAPASITVAFFAGF
jgi:hypothetical protein